MTSVGVSTLRAIVNKLNNSSSEDLLLQISLISASIENSKSILQSASTKNESQSLIHKLKTKTSALLQDRTVQGRFCGVVLAGSIIRNGGQTFLAESNSWIRGLISCLNRPDIDAVRQSCVSTINEIYLATVDDQAIIREVTTPTLPAYITTSLSIIKPSTITKQPGDIVRVLNPLLEPVLRSWYALIEHFASTFRPHATSIRAICLSLLCDTTCLTTVSKLATKLLARLHYCATKGNISQEWSQLCSSTIEAMHDTADLTFRAVIEDWSSTVPRTTKITKKQKTASTPATSALDALGLTQWQGIGQGIDRLCAQLDLLQALLAGPHACDVNLPLGTIVNLTARLSSITLPSQKFTLRSNNEISRDEREELYLNLPRLHITLLSLYTSLSQAYGARLLPISQTLVSQIWDIFEAEHQIDSLRESAYRLLQIIFTENLYVFHKSDVEHISRLVQDVCNDLVPSTSIVSASDTTKSTTKLTLDDPRSTTLKVQKQTALRQTASDLLPILISELPFHLLPNSLRTRLDQTAILTNNHETILASVLYPAQRKSGQTQPSLMPFLARLNGKDASHEWGLAREALLRPRMPVTTKDYSNITRGQEERLDDQESGDGAQEADDESESPLGEIYPATNIGGTTGHEHEIGTNTTNQPQYTTTESPVDLPDILPSKRKSPDTATPITRPDTKKARSNILQPPSTAEGGLLDVPSSPDPEIPDQTFDHSMLDTSDMTPGISSLDKGKMPRTDYVYNPGSYDDGDDSDDIIPPLDGTLRSFTSDEEDEDEPVITSL